MLTFTVHMDLSEDAHEFDGFSLLRFAKATRLSSEIFLQMSPVAPSPSFRLIHTLRPYLLHTTEGYEFLDHAHEDAHYPQ